MWASHCAACKNKCKRENEGFCFFDAHEAALYSMSHFMIVDIIAWLDSLFYDIFVL